jgi:hypothetical protein
MNLFSLPAPATRMNTLHRRLLTMFSVAIAFFCTATLSAQQEQRVTERRTMTDEQGQTHKTSSVVETRIEDLLPPVTNIIHTGAFRLPWMYNLNYVHAISNQFAVGGGLEFATNLDGQQNRGWGIVAEARFYPGNPGQALRGFYVAGGINVHSLQRERIDYTPDPVNHMNPGQFKTETLYFTPLSLGLTTGWVLFAWKDLAIDLGLGVKHHLISAQYRNRFGSSGGMENVGPDIFAGTAPTVRINVGYAW